MNGLQLLPSSPSLGFPGGNALELLFEVPFVPFFSAAALDHSGRVPASWDLGQSELREFFGKIMNDGVSGVGGGGDEDEMNLLGGFAGMDEDTLGLGAPRPLPLPPQLLSCKAVENEFLSALRTRGGPGPQASSAITSRLLDLPIMPASGPVLGRTGSSLTDRALSVCEAAMKGRRAFPGGAPTLGLRGGLDALVEMDLNEGADGIYTLPQLILDADGRSPAAGSSAREGARPAEALGLALENLLEANPSARSSSRRTCVPQMALDLDWSLIQPFSADVWPSTLLGLPQLRPDYLPALQPRSGDQGRVAINLLTQPPRSRMPNEIRQQRGAVLEKKLCRVASASCQELLTTSCKRKRFDETAVSCVDEPAAVSIATAPPLVHIISVPLRGPALRLMEILASREGAAMRRVKGLIVKGQGTSVLQDMVCCAGSH